MGLVTSLDRRGDNESISCCEIVLFDFFGWVSCETELER